MKQTLRDFLCPQPKSKIKAGDGQLKGAYNFYTSSQIQSKFYHSATYTQPALIFGTGGMASVHYCNEPFSTSTDCLVMYGRLGAPLELIYYYLRSNMHLLQDGFKGAGLQHISKDYILNININMPAPSLQEQITHQMRLIDAMINGKKQQILSFDEAVKSRFIELFGDYDLTHPQESWAPIKEVGTVVGGATPKTDHDEYWGGSYRWITPAELDADSGYIYDSVRKLTKAGVESCSLQEMPVGTVILSSRAPIGKVAIAGNTFYCNQGFKNIICKEGITPRYLYTVLLLNVEYLNSLGRGATFKEISKGIVESIRIPVPSMELQEQFAAFVEQTDKSKYYSSLSFRYCQAAANTYRQEWMTCRTSDF